MAKKNVAKNCKHKKEFYKDYLVSPINNDEKNFNRIVNYFLYKTPGIDSAHSPEKIIDNEVASKILFKMIKTAKMQNRYNFIQRIQPKSFEIFQLDGNEICVQCPRMVCKKMKSETELDALLRHLRNAFAHGYAYIKKTKNNTYIVLEDYYTDKNKNKKLSAKIVLTKSILEKWKEIIKSQIN